MSDILNASTNFVIGADGQISFRLPSGAVVSLPQASFLGIDTAAPSFHSYASDSWVGITSNYFDAGLETSLLGFNPTTAANAYRALTHVPAPIDNIPSLPAVDIVLNSVLNGAVQNGQVTNLDIVGPVTTYTFPNQQMIVNVTNPGHLLHPGVVVRYVTEVNGELRIVTEGVGVGDFGAANILLNNPLWSAVDSQLSTILNKYGEEEVPEVLDPVQPDNAKYCFAAGTPIEMADGTTKPIEDIRLGDKVLAFDPDAEGGRGVKVAKRVTQLHRTENQPLINFHGTKVTPGHTYLTGEGAFLPIIEILQNDGTVVMSDGRVIRARTGWPLDSREDRAIPIGYPEGSAIKLTTMRAGTLYGGKDGKAFTIEQMMNSRGYHMMSDGRFIGVEGDIKTAYWEWGVPDDKMIAGKYAAYADLVEGAAIGIGMPLVPSRPN